MTSQDPNNELSGWEKSAQYWGKYRRLIEQMFAPLTSALIEEARIGSGQRVLDIGGGAGEPSLTIASIVGPAGSVTYTDPVAGMVETARAEAKKRGLTNIEFNQCSADELPFAGNTFDVAVGRLSVMFFENPAVGLREIVRVTNEGGYVSFVVWGREESNPFFSIISDAIDRFMPVSASDSAAPDPFRFAVSGKLAEILKAVNAENVVERQMAFNVEAAISFDQFWQLRTEMSESLREKVAQLTPAQLSVVKQEVSEAGRKYFADGKMSFPAKALIITGRKPA
ncbi:MAG TPA: methyltransferase domain-containing protein [Chthoniobacterales bacterium]|nr:methyltransferase domain-containing protein [Chthoniobacterales bacterium]